MNCEEASLLMEAHLDSELDARSAAEITAHLESCRTCAGAFESARRGNQRIGAFLQQPSERAAGTGEMWGRIEREIVSAARSGHHRARWWVTAGIAAVLILAASLWLHPRDDEGSSLVAALERDHSEFLAGEFGPAFQGPPSEHILSTAGGRVDAPAFAALPTGADFTIEGSRLCHLSGVPVAWTLVRYHGQPVSWVALRREELAHFPDIQKQLDSGGKIAGVKTGAFHFAARVVGDHVVCALGDFGIPELEALLKSVPGGGSG
ncbi:MAG: anti-sigma factor family protein [Verrucomicrobiales bacterium]